MVGWMPAATGSVNRLSADERREAVLDAAVHEFAQAGYHAASTTNIAKRAGISQPYIYALFPNKKALFIAVQERVSQRIRDAFTQAAAEATSPEDRVERMGTPTRASSTTATTCSRSCTASPRPATRRSANPSRRASARRSTRSPS